MKVMETHIRTDFNLDILKESIAVDITASRSPIMEVKAAMQTKKKNNIEQPNTIEVHTKKDSKEEGLNLIA